MVQKRYTDIMEALYNAYHCRVAGIKMIFVRCTSPTIAQYTEQVKYLRVHYIISRDINDTASCQSGQPVFAAADEVSGVHPIPNGEAEEVEFGNHAVFVQVRAQTSV
jgi:V8-like Glu-specific endopeptidase